MGSEAVTNAPHGVRFPLVTLFVASITLFTYYVYRRALPKPLPGIPYDETAAKKVLGSLPSMFSHWKQHGVLMPWLTGHNLKHNAPLVQFFGAPFAQPTLVLSDFQESQDILLRRSKEFERADRTLQSFEGLIPHHHLAMRTNDPRFKGNKELVRDLMSPKFLHEASAIRIYQKSLALIDLWSLKVKASGGRPFPARQDIFDAALDMVSGAAFGFKDDLSITKRQLNHFLSNGVELEEHQNGSVDFPRIPIPTEIATLQAVADYLGTQIMSPLPRITNTYNMLTNSKLRQTIAMKDEIIMAQIKNSVESLKNGNETPQSATDYMVHREFSVARKEGRELDLFSKRTMDELFGYIVGGHETTSSSLSWALKFIGDHQPEQDKLRQALWDAFPDAAVEERLPSVKEITTANVPYLDAIIDECLRLGQPTPLVAREAVVDAMLLGHLIPKGVTILINSSGPGYTSSPTEVADSARSEASRTKNAVGSWSKDDMHSFNPERWLKTSDSGEVVYDSQAGPFLSFSLGPRGCFGKRLAYLEMRIVLTLLTWNFRFAKLEGELAKYDTLESVTVMPRTCYVGLERVEL